MRSKHGQWFEYDRYIAIHENVINDYQWLIQSGDTQYKINKIKSGKRLQELKFEIKFTTSNRFMIYITKRAEVSPKQTKVRTSFFSYHCQKLGYQLRYDSAHDETYNPNAPWHNHPHRHEIKDNSQKINIYGDDHRPKSDKSRRSYTSEGKRVTIEFLGHKNWPHVKEFLDEVNGM